MVRAPEVTAMNLRNGVMGRELRNTLFSLMADSVSNESGGTKQCVSNHVLALHKVKTSKS